MGDESAVPLPVFLEEGGGRTVISSHNGQGCPLFDFVHPATPLRIMASPAFHDSLKDDSGQAVASYQLSSSSLFF